MLWDSVQQDAEYQCHCCLQSHWKVALSKAVSQDWAVPTSSRIWQNRASIWGPLLTKCWKSEPLLVVTALVKSGVHFDKNFQHRAGENWRPSSSPNDFRCLLLRLDYPGGLGLARSWQTTTQPRLTKRGETASLSQYLHSSRATSACSCCPWAGLIQIRVNTWQEEDHNRSVLSLLHRVLWWSPIGTISIPLPQSLSGLLVWAVEGGLQT